MLTRPRLGRRGHALLTFATLDIIYGFRISVVPGGDRSVYAWLATGLIPLWVWSIAWIAVGLVCAGYALRIDDRPAFNTAITLKLAWGALNVIGWATGDIADGWILATFWLAFARCVALLSGMTEPVDGEGAAWTPPSP